MAAVDGKLTEARRRGPLRTDGGCQELIGKHQLGILRQEMGASM